MFVALFSLVLISLSNGYIVGVYRASDVPAMPMPYGVGEEVQFEPRDMKLFNATATTVTTTETNVRPVKAAWRSIVLRILGLPQMTTMRSINQGFGEAILPLDDSEFLVIQPQLQPLLISNAQVEMPQVPQVPMVQQVPMQLMPQRVHMPIYEEEFTGY